MTYHGYQINPKEASKEVHSVLQEYIKKHGLPERILLEVSNQLEPVELSEGMNVVTKAVRIPKNLILIGLE